MTVSGGAGATRACPAPARVAVLGATGSVGRQVCLAFAERGWEVLGVARRWAPHVADYRFVAMDLAATDPRRIADLFGDGPVDVVVNAAGGWGDTEEEMTYSHVRLVDRLLEAVAMLPQRSRLVHIGSVHEYGPVPQGTLLNEDVTPHPVTTYARTKLAVSQAVLQATRAQGVNAVVLRAANMSGPYPPRESFLAALVGRLHAARAANQILELNIAEARRDFIDVRDVAAAIVRAGEAQVDGRVVNIGRGEAVSIGDLVEWLIEAAEFPRRMIAYRREQVESKGGDWTQLDICLARRLLSWEPQISLRDSVRAMWQVSDHTESV
ncbi:MAG TPA: NAD-dependent epimerase/dehydratase [Pseudonocardiaceae bacterium]|nr:NAD-dependent epimerase/dehydratase [Pseudonocardiaceae bacterium]